MIPVTDPTSPNLQVSVSPSDLEKWREASKLTFGISARKTSTKSGVPIDHYEITFRRNDDFLDETICLPFHRYIDRNVSGRPFIFDEFGKLQRVSEQPSLWEILNFLYCEHTECFTSFLGEYWTILKARLLTCSCKEITFKLFSCKTCKQLFCSWCYRDHQHERPHQERNDDTHR